MGEGRGRVGADGRPWSTTCCCSRGSTAGRPLEARRGRLSAGSSSRRSTTRGSSMPADVWRLSLPDEPLACARGRAAAPPGGQQPAQQRPPAHPAGHDRDGRADRRRRPDRRSRHHACTTTGPVCRRRCVARSSTGSAAATEPDAGLGRRRPRAVDRQGDRRGPRRHGAVESHRATRCSPSRCRHAQPSTRTLRTADPRSPTPRQSPCAGMSGSPGRAHGLRRDHRGDTCEPLGRYCAFCRNAGLGLSPVVRGRLSTDRTYPRRCACHTA